MRLPPRGEGWLSLPRAGRERCDGNSSKRDAIRRHWLISCESVVLRCDVELLVAGAVIIFSIGLGLVVASSILSLIFSLMVSGLRRTAVAAVAPAGELAYEAPTLRYTAPAA